MNKPLFQLFGFLLLVNLLAACSSGPDLFTDDEDRRLTGERISILELEESLEPDDETLETEGLTAPDPWQNAFWPQAGGYPNHSMQHLVLGEYPLKRIWSTHIGAGSSDEIPLTAQPIVVQGRIFTLNTQGTVSAFDTKNGNKVWDKNTRANSDDDAVIGGGLAFGEGLIFVTNGYNEIVALQPADGKTIWRTALPSAVRAAPTVLNGRVFVMTLDNRLLALTIPNGAVLWEYVGIGEGTGIIGAASPAANNEIVLPAFSSGEIVALLVENGAVAWSDNLSRVRSFGGLSGIADIKALPILDKELAIAVSFGGRIAAIDQRTGVRIWQREIGSTNTPWIAGNHLFIISNENQLVALGRKRGSIRWVTPLPYDKDEPVVFTGPIMAGGRLLTFRSDGRVFEADPETGAITHDWGLGSDVMIPPLIAGGVLYVLREDGTLLAYQ